MRSELAASIAVGLAGAAMMFAGYSVNQTQHQRRAEVIATTATVARNDTSLTSWYMYRDSDGIEHKKQLALFTPGVRNGTISIDYRRDDPDQSWPQSRSPFSLKRWPLVLGAAGGVFACAGAVVGIYFAWFASRPDTEHLRDG
jgi:hypothetical protein